jgi:hypothetical protein
MSREPFDPIATVIDWLDACKAGQLEDLLALYSGNATIECRCARVTLTGRTALAAYWEPKLKASSPTAFSLDDVALDDQGVSLDYTHPRVRGIFGRGTHEKREIRRAWSHLMGMFNPAVADPTYPVTCRQNMFARPSSRSSGRSLIGIKIPNQRIGKHRRRLHDFTTPGSKRMVGEPTN